MPVLNELRYQELYGFILLLASNHSIDTNVKTSQFIPRAWSCGYKCTLVHCWRSIVDRLSGACQHIGLRSFKCKLMLTCCCLWSLDLLCGLQNRHSGHPKLVIIYIVYIGDHNALICQIDLAAQKNVYCCMECPLQTSDTVCDTFNWNNYYFFRKPF